MILTIYKTIDHFTPQLNGLIEDFDIWLRDTAGVVYTDQNFQFIKPALTTSIKIDVPQTVSLPDNPIGNYLSLVENGENGEKYTTYYFIVGSRWAAQSTVYLDLQMDTLNTFPGILNDIDDKTTIIRQHRDRFFKTDRLVRGQTALLTNIINDIPEPIGDCPKYLDEKVAIEGDSNGNINQPWYLVYRTPEDPTEHQPVECLLVPQNPIPLGKGKKTFILDDFSRNNTYYILSSEYPSASITVGSTTYSLASGEYSYFIFGRTAQTSGQPDVITVAAVKSSSFVQNVATGSTIKIEGAASGWILPVSFADAPYDTAKAQQGTRWTIATSSTEWTYSIGIDSIDRTNPRNMKIIQCPYCPIELD